ncbi:MAG: excisionase family DNA-binding protein [Nocardioidaceae bacterium]|nr:excisionase family DNA-binding protein [Nocardioidaceae bacterium]
MSGQTYFTRREAAAEMRVSEKTIERAIASGRLRAKRTGENGGGQYRISRAALEEWFDGLVDA